VVRDVCVSLCVCVCVYVEDVLSKTTTAAVVASHIKILQHELET